MSALGTASTGIYPIGRILNGRYLVQRSVPSDECVSLYIARDQLTSDNVTIKEFCPDVHPSGQEHIFENEVSTLKRLQHRNIIALLDNFSQNGRLYIVHEYLASMSLASLLAMDGCLPVELAFPVFSEILDALAHAHQNGIVHGSIKPRSIVLLAESSGAELAKLAGFGRAVIKSKTLSADERNLYQEPATYLSPEHLNGTAIDERSDIYCLGLVMYEAVTGKPPYTGDTNEEIVQKHLNSLPPRFRGIASELNIPFEVEAIILGCLAKKPQDRYQSVEELMNSINAWKSAQKARSASAAPMSFAPDPADDKPPIRSRRQVVMDLYSSSPENTSNTEATSSAMAVATNLTEEPQAPNDSKITSISFAPEAVPTLQSQKALIRHRIAVAASLTLVIVAGVATCNFILCTFAGSRPTELAYRPAPTSIVQTANDDVQPRNEISPADSMPGKRSRQVRHRRSPTYAAISPRRRAYQTSYYFRR
ncbi:MAG TPA: serine/threonine-protein kinase, partial [Candidatus Obscuribacterales bacterium]